MTGPLTVVTAPCWWIHRPSRLSLGRSRLATSSAAGRPDTEMLLSAAVAGDAEAFRLATAPHRRELLVHCHRMLGSLDDADDAVQETLLKRVAPPGRLRGSGDAAAWLYRIATNVRLDALDHRDRRILPTAILSPADPHLPPDPDDADTPWLQPFRTP